MGIGLESLDLMSWSEYDLFNDGLRDLDDLAS